MVATEAPPSEADREKRLAELRQQRANQRARLLQRLDDEDAWTHAERLRKCGEPIGLTCTSCGREHTVWKRCDLKWCPSCAPLLAHRAVQRYGPVCAEFLSPLFVTFTCKNFNTRAKTGIRDIRRAFTKLRRLRWWKRAVAGGVASFELTRKGKGWHPHCHALIDCAWLAVTVPAPGRGLTPEQFKARAKAAAEEVAEQWTLTLGRAGSVKVRRRGLQQSQSADAVREVLKYSVTMESLDKIRGKLEPMLDELSCTRNLVSWGTAYRHPSLKKPKADPRPCDCGEFGTKMPTALVDRMLRTRR